MNSTVIQSFHGFLLFAILTIGIGPIGQGRSIPTDAPEPKYAEQQARLIHAIWDQDFKTAEHLLQEGLNPNFLFRRTPQDAFITPLSEAIATRQTHIFTLLFEHGAEASFGEKSGAGALSSAAWYDDIDMVKELLKRGASVNVRDDEGYTALLQASYRSRDLTVIKLLIAAGADAKAKSSNTHMTTVMLAASSLNLDAVNLFIALGVDPCAKDSAGETAVDSANTQILLANEKDKLNTRVAILKLLKNKCVAH